jgi:hypothetical protein
LQILSQPLAAGKRDRAFEDVIDAIICELRGDAGDRQP